MSPASKRALITATASAPAANTWGAFCRVMPPIATNGNAKLRRAAAKIASGARTAPGLVTELNSLGRRAKRKSIFGRCAHRGYDLGMRVARDHRPPGADVIDIAPAFAIPHAGAR